jgi:[acyl-carrier-protein] S-malonyltransferase
LGLTVFMFPGQGSQYVGMGRKLWESDRCVREIYGLACKETGLDIAGLSFEGPAEELDDDITAQLAVYVCNEAHRTAAASAGFRPDAVTGYSLGFYSALVAAGSLGFLDGLAAVRAAGELAMDASSRRPGTMGAVIGLSLEEVESICRESSREAPVWVSNINAARQVLVSGSVEGVDKAVGRAVETGALKAFRLAMGAAYHSPMMDDAARKFSSHVAKLNITAPSVRLMSYLDAGYLGEPDEIAATVATQITRRVLWKDSVERLVADGVSRFVEIGPGFALTRMVRWVDRSVDASSVDDGPYPGAGTVRIR